MRIRENHAADEHKAYLLLVRSDFEEKELPETVADNDIQNVLPNFRQGDAIILYERNCGTDNVTNKMVFKGNIEHLTDHEISIRLRATQQNPSVLPADSLYAIEHDMMDTTFRSMYQGLYAYLCNTGTSRLIAGSVRRSSTNHWILLFHRRKTTSPVSH